MAHRIREEVSGIISGTGYEALVFRSPQGCANTVWSVWIICRQYFIPSVLRELEPPGNKLDGLAKGSNEKGAAFTAPFSFEIIFAPRGAAR
jgi:hypothetical protein